jgi:hypothetical protein
VAYCSQDDVQRAAGTQLRLAQICNPTSEIPSIDAVAVAAAIDEATAWMGQWVAGMVTAASPPEACRWMCARETLYLLQWNHGNAGDRDVIAHQERQAQLIRIQAAGAWPGDTPPPPRSTAAGPVCVTSAPDTAEWTKDTLKGWS